MKKFLAAFLALLMLCSFCFSAQATIQTDMIPLVESESADDSHMFTVDDQGRLHVQATTKDHSSDAYANSKLILHRPVSDFTLEFDYIPNKVAWNQDRISFRCAGDENEWNQYMILIRGSEMGEGSRGVSIVKGEALDNPYAHKDFVMNEGTQYFAKLEVTGNKVTLYFDSDPNFANGPLLEAELPNDGSSYLNSYVAEGDFQIISWGGDFNMSYFRLVEGQEEIPYFPAEWYPHNTVCVAGIAFRDAKPELTQKWYNFAAIDLSQDSIQQYDLVASNKYVVGTVTVTVTGDQVVIDQKINRQGTTDANYLPESEFMTIFSSLDAVTEVEPEQYEGPTYAFGQPISIQNDLGGDTNVLLYIRNVATYCTNLSYKNQRPLYHPEYDVNEGWRIESRGVMQAIMDADTIR